MESDQKSSGAAVTASTSSKLMYLIKRRATVSREELVANWFANHMPGVIQGQHAQAERGRPHATRYIATLYDPPADGPQRWDGVAQLWWTEEPQRPSEPHGLEPRDTFQQKAEPYVPWATTEYPVIDGDIGVEANTLNEPFPCTRSGFVKATTLVKAKPGIDFDEFYRYWLGHHAENVATAAAAAGGLRYVISLSNDPAGEPYAGMAELYFAGLDEVRECRRLLSPDDMDTWVDRPNSESLLATTEMVGIP